MFRKILFFLALNLSFLSFAQQNPEFRQVKQYFDTQRSGLIKSFENAMNSRQSDEEKTLIREQFTEFMVKMDSLQNYAYLGTLVKVKTLEDLAKINKQSVETSAKNSPGITETNAEYPGGINTLRQQIADLFYTGELLPTDETYKTTVRFVVERDGSISTVEAYGDNFAFNKQAMVAVYLLPDNFKPAQLNGVPVRSRFSVPLTLKFD